MTSNTKRGVPVVLAEEFRLYDDLPPFFRRVYQNAALDFAVTHGVKSYRSARAHMSERDAKRWWLRAVRAAEDRETYATYGPSHPEARADLRDIKPAPYAVWGRP